VIHTQLRVWDNVRVYIFNRPISDEPTKISGIKTEYMPIAVVQCGSYFSFNDYFKKVQITDKIKGLV
jgi:hypothetical protein